jgi:hypothetical protein
MAGGVGAGGTCVACDQERGSRFSIVDIVAPHALGNAARMERECHAGKPEGDQCRGKDDKTDSQAFHQILPFASGSPAILFFLDPSALCPRLSVGFTLHEGSVCGLLPWSPPMNFLQYSICSPCFFSPPPSG